MATIQKPLSNVQVELLKLFATNMSDEDIRDLRSQLAQFYAKKSIEAADKIWDERGYTNELMHEWLNEENQ
ncbi:MAG: hypothetical protein MUE30_15735 [Spirosomaceae bacterium]|nr:hypothetical protein [Spirosomataceae bacterium]